MNIKLIVAALVLLAVGAGAGYWWAHHKMSSTESKAAEKPAAEKPSAAKSEATAAAKS